MTNDEEARVAWYESRALIVAAQGKYCPFHGDKLVDMQLVGCMGCYCAGVIEKMYPPSRG